MPKRKVSAKIQLEISCHPKVEPHPQTVEGFHWLQNLTDMIRIKMKNNPEEIRIYVEEVE
jgi:hypothetical protein